MPETVGRWVEENELVNRMARAMREKLEHHRQKGTWRTETPERMLMRLKQEVLELEFTMLWAGPGAVWAEAADVANFAAMVAAQFESVGLAR